MKRMILALLTCVALAASSPPSGLRPFSLIRRAIQGCSNASSTDGFRFYVTERVKQDAFGWYNPQTS